MKMTGLWAGRPGFDSCQEPTRTDSVKVKQLNMRPYWAREPLRSCKKITGCFVLREKNRHTVILLTVYERE